MVPFIYNLLLLLLSPIIALFLLHRIFISGKSKHSWRQQMGCVVLSDELKQKNKIWVHAVSVGESVASAAVVSEIKKSLPDTAVVMSTTTQTGQEMAHKSVKDADGFLYYPFDLLPFVARSLTRVKPVVFASTDTEIWPNFLCVAHKRGIKTAMINGTVSDRTLSGAKKVPWVYRWALGNVDKFCMQSQADAKRIIIMGANPKNVLVTGNCKADQAVIPMTKHDIQELYDKYKVQNGAHVFVAGSTNPGEDEPIIEAYINLRKTYTDLKLIIAPRQIERGPEINEIASGKGLKCGFRSMPETITGDEDIVVLNTFGELGKAYAIADVSFVGGSLIPRGCHSILQPISQGKPVFFGPYTFKAKDLVAQAKSYGVGFEIKDSEELGNEISKLLADRESLNRIKIKCGEMMQANLGASKRTADALASLYKEAIGLQGDCLECDRLS